MNIKGFLVAKNLLACVFREENYSIEESRITLQDPLIIYHNINLLDLLIIFQTCKGVTALVSELEKPDRILGEDFDEVRVYYKKITYRNNTRLTH